MSNKEYVRKHKEDRPVVAICYDFDKTLSPDDMQAQGFIQSVGYEISEFWQESNGLAERNDMDQNLAYMFKMMETAEGRVLFTKDALLKYGAQVHLFPGVENWFRRIRDYGETHGVIVEHYIISSGLKEMIEGTAIAGEFEKIYASSLTNERLEEIHFRCKKENIEADKLNSEEERQKTDLMIALENSHSFTRTHEVIKKLSRYSAWSPEELALLFQIAVNNSQVKYIIKDRDVKLFYTGLFTFVKRLTEDMRTVKELMENEE